MEVSRTASRRSHSEAAADPRTDGPLELPRGRASVVRFPLIRLAAGAAGVVFLTETVAAHGAHGFGGEPATLVAVSGLPVVAGLGAGLIVTRRRRSDRTAGPRTGVVLAALLAFLGATMAFSAVTADRQLGIAGGTVGGLFVLWARRDAGTVTCGCHAAPALHVHHALVAVTAHRFLEGAAVGALYGIGATVGLVGAVILAGHAALESLAVGGMYATGRRRIRAVGAVVLVQAGYIVGILVEIGISSAVPVSVHVFGLAIAGGALLGVGAVEATGSLAKLPGERHSA